MPVKARQGALHAFFAPKKKVEPTLRAPPSGKPSASSPSSSSSPPRPQQQQQQQQQPNLPLPAPFTRYSEAECSRAEAKRFARFQKMRAAAIEQEQRPAIIEPELPLTPIEDARRAFYGTVEGWVETNIPENEPKRRVVGPQEAMLPDKDLFEGGHLSDAREPGTTENDDLDMSDAYPAPSRLPPIDVSSLSMEQMAPKRPQRDIIRAQCKDNEKHVLKKWAKSDLRRVMDTLHPQWNSDPACAYLFKQSKTISAGFKDNQQWTERYRPRAIEGLLGNNENYTYLARWLETLLVASPPTAQEPTKKTNKRSRKSKSPGIDMKNLKIGDSKQNGDDDYFDEDSEMEDPEEYENNEDDDDDFAPGAVPKRKKAKNQRVRSNLILLFGKHGIGKTAAVYTAAEEVGYSVFELNSNTRRGGKDITAAVGEMTESHQVSFHAGKKRGLPIASTVQPPKKVQNTGLFNHFKRIEPEKKEEAPPPPPESESESEADEPEVKGKPKQSLVLLEEVDILYEDDKGFWSAVTELAEKSKRPIILTCNDVDVIPVDTLPLESALEIQPLTIQELVPYLQLVTLIEGYLIDPRVLLALAIEKSMDLRRCLQTLQLECDCTPKGDGGFTLAGQNYFSNLPDFTFCNGVDLSALVRPKDLKVKESMRGLGNLHEAFSTPSMQDIARVLDRAAFADAYLMPHDSKAQTQLLSSTGDNIVGVAGHLHHETVEPPIDDFHNALRGYEACVSRLNAKEFKTKKWQQRMHSITTMNDLLYSIRFQTYQICADSIDRLLPTRMQYMPDRSTLMEYYVPHIRDMCLHENKASILNRSRGRLGRRTVSKRHFGTRLTNEDEEDLIAAYENLDLEKQLQHSSKRGDIYTKRYQSLFHS
ncbi:hypothetical protein BCR43DRAFT_565739 [Syncephalastrum racemosum]|uniref:AAA+ ATPase domain-containing protein n=1 Tax=Syncephalastrum racemosum TaxID=13706 RepID=A0A1X2H421_SYNRA|nr:hypothetical protein BCR43DRAFT_565739 [Syncephalastrum racemosum]